MANRYWIGGSGNWSDTNHWSTTSGGSGGADIPTSSDDVFIDSNSGFGSGGTIRPVGESVCCNNFLSNSGHNFIIDGETGLELSIYGSLTLESGITVSGELVLILQSTSSGKTITTAGVILHSMNVIGVGGEWTLQDNLEMNGMFYQENGTFDANDHNVTANDFSFYADTGYTPTVIMGGGTWEATGEGDVWYFDNNNGEIITFFPETSTLKLTNSSSNYKYLYGVYGTSKYYGMTLNNLWISGTGTGIFNLSGSWTFNDLKIDKGLKMVVDYDFDGGISFDGDTITVSSLTAIGELGNLISFNTFDGTGQFIFSKSSGTVSCDYLDISNSNVTGGATWYAGSHSVDTTNNDGWLFEDVPIKGPFPTYRAA